MRSFLLLCFLGLVCSLSSVHADKKPPRIDIDNGVAITGNGQAIRTNPAALPDFGTSLVDFGVYNRSDYGLVGQMSTNIVENIGVGVAVDHLGGQTVVAPGFGFTTGKWSAGVATTVFPSSMSFDNFTVGLRWDKGDDFSVGLVCYDVPELRNFAVGFGIARSQKWKAEIDANLLFADSSYDLQSAVARLAVSYLPAHSVWLMARVLVPIVPSMQVDRRNIELGMHIWFSSRVALYVLYQNPLATVVAGLKMRI